VGRVGSGGEGGKGVGRGGRKGCGGREQRGLSKGCGEWRDVGIKGKGVGRDKVYVRIKGMEGVGRGEGKGVHGI
jgi:hypothetical protein